VLNLHENQIR